MTQEEINNYVLSNVSFPSDYPQDFEINDNLLEGNHTLIIPNVFPGAISIINNEGLLMVDIPQYEYIDENGIYGVKIDFKDYLFQDNESDSSNSNGNSLSINGWKIRYNRGIAGDPANSDDIGLTGEELIKFSLIF